MKKSQANTKTFTPRLIIAALLGGWFAVLFFFSFGDVSVISPELVYTQNIWLFLSIWLGVSGALLLYGSICPSFVHIFSLCATLLYCTRAAFSGGSYPLTFGLCGIMALMFALSWSQIKLPKWSALSKKGQVILTCITGGVLGGWMLFLMISAYLTYTTSPTASTSVYAQMLYQMSQTLTPNTTLEFGEVISHFGVHISPIFYLYLPFYMVFPSPVTLFVLQTVAVISAVIPLSLIARRKGLTRSATCVVCILLCLFPTLIGSATGGIHEYALLLPLLLWLLWALECEKPWLVGIFALLCLCIRETVAVYVFAVGLYWLLSRGFGKETSNQIKNRVTSLVLMGVSAVYLVVALLILTYAGEGTLITRFANITGTYNTSFGTLIKEIFMNPSIAIFEILTPEKLYFVLFLVLPLGILPFLSKKKAGFVFLLPLLLLNLLSDFPYHFNPAYPYAFGLTAVLFYLVVISLGERQANGKEKSSVGGVLVAALCMTLIVGSFSASTQTYQMEYLAEGGDESKQITEVLQSIPQDVSVSASGRLIPHLSGRNDIYSLSHKVETIYVVLDLRDEWQVSGEQDISLDTYKEKGYEVVTNIDGVIAVCKKIG